MTMLLRFILSALVAALPSLALAQGAVTQSGTPVSGHAPMYQAGGGLSGVVTDSGAASGGGINLGLSEILQVSRGTGILPVAGSGTGPLGTHDCHYDAPITNPTGGHFLCFDANAGGGELIAAGAFGGATPAPLLVNVNGTTYPFPGSGTGNVVGPSTSAVGDVACYNNLTGTLLKDCLLSSFALTGSANTYTGNNFFGSGYPWADVKAFGAVGNGIADDHTAIGNANAIIAGLGSGTIYFPVGIYCDKTGTTFSTSSEILRGATGDAGSQYSACGANVTLITLSGQSSEINHLFINGAPLPTSGPPSHPALVLSGVDQVLSDVRVSQGSTGILTTSSADYTLFNVNVTDSYGNAMVDIVNGGGYIIRDKLDQTFPSGNVPSYGLAISPWQANTNYSVSCSGTCLASFTYNTATYIMQVVGCVSSCTSGGGSAPAPASYGVNVVDNQVTWQLLAPSPYYALRCNSGCGIDEIFGDHSGPFTSGIRIANDNSGSNPGTIIIQDAVTGQNFGPSVEVKAGANVEISDAQFVGCLLAQCSGIAFESTFTGQGSVHNSQVAGAYTNIAILGGTKFLISGNFLAGAYDAAVTIGTASNITLTGNDQGGSGSLYGTSSYALRFQTTGSDYVNSSGNDYNGFSVAALAGTSNGTHNRFTDNMGYNGVSGCGSSGVTVGTSPATITNGSTPATYYLLQSATNTATVKLGGTAVVAATLSSATLPAAITLGPNESMVVTWTTTAPTYQVCTH